MNVLFIYYVPSGGVDTLNRLRCKALRKAGIQAHCLYYRWGAGMQNPVDFPVHVTSNDIGMKRILDAGKYQAIVATTDHTVFPRLRLLGYTGKLILEIQGYGAKSYARKQLTGARPIIARHASALLHPGTPHIDALFRELYPNMPRFVFNNLFDPSVFGYRPSGKQTRPIIAWMGRITDNKNWREFLKIGHRLSQHYPKLLLWMFEDASLADLKERQLFHRMVRSLRLEERLVIRSNVPHADMPYYLSRVGDSGGFLCSTSKVEGAPYAVLEAMSCRCPVLTTNSDGVSTSVFHNKTGKYYQLGNIDDAVREARELMENKPLREQIRTAAKQHVHTAFAPDLYVKNFMHMLRSI